MKIEPTKKNEHVGIVRNERRGICVYVPRWWAGRRVRVTLEDAPDHIVDISKKVETEPKAAPDLLEALQDILERLATSPMQDKELADMCREKIAAATKE